MAFSAVHSTGLSRGQRLAPRALSAQVLRRPNRTSFRKLTTLVKAEAVNTDELYGIFKVEYDISNEDPALTKNWKPIIRVAVSGEVFGRDQPIALQLLGSERSREALEGVAMELEDSLYPLLREVKIGIDPLKVFKDADWALLIGAKPRGPGMERADLLSINGQIFQEQGQALNAVAKRDVKVMVVGNPCNTNALIAMKNAPDLEPKNFHALTRLDENRAKCQLAMKSGKFYTSIKRVAIWGNHSTTQVPDFVNAMVAGKPAIQVIEDMDWFKNKFTPVVASRGGALIKKWGRSSAASTAVSIADAIRALLVPTPKGDCFSTAVFAAGNPYGINEDIFYSFPCKSKGDGSYEICTDFIIDEWLRNKLAASEDELVKERDCVAYMIPGAGPAACAITEDTMLPGEA